MQSSITCDTQYKFLYYDQYSVKCLIEWQVIWHHFTNTKKPSSDLCPCSLLMDTLPLVLNEMKKNQWLNQINKREPLKNQS